MSHWTSVKTKITDLSALEEVAKELGLTVTKGKGTKLTSLFQADQDAEMLFEYSGGLAGVVRDKEGNLTFSIDNFGNPIVSKVGADCSYLSKQYSTKVVWKQAMMMGGYVTGQETLEDGSVEMTIQV